jgi:hypothetical protein
VVRPTAGDTRDQALGRNGRGKKWGGRKVYGWGEKNGLLRAGLEKEKRGKENKTKQKKKLAGCSWLGGGERKEREREKRPAASYLAGWEREKRERERERKKNKRPAAYQLAGWEKEKRERGRKKKGLLYTWLGGRKKREGRKNKIK